MINIPDFLKYVWRYKWLVAIVPCICGVTAFFIAKNLPRTYKSNVQLSTGITDRSQEILSGDQLDYFRVSQQFGNIIEMMNTKRVLNMLSLHLILHDLENPSSALGALPEDVAKLPEGEVSEVVTLLKEKQVNNEFITPADNGKYALFDWIEYMGYDEKTIADQLTIYRHGESDFINVEYTSENPQLSAFVVNTFAREFIYYYGHVTSTSKQATLLLLDSILTAKKAVMDEKNTQLKSFKAGSGVLNLSAQSDMIYQQIAEQEGRRSQLIGEIQSLQGGIRNINEKLNDESLNGGNSSIKENNEIVQIGRQLEQANKRYFDNNFDPADKKIVDSLELLRTTRIASMSRQSTTSPYEVRRGLLKEKSDLEIALARAENSISSINAELGSLRARFGAMMPADAGVQNLEREVDLAVTEYTEAMKRYNQATLENSASLNLRIVESGFPGMAEPAKVMQLTVISGFASLMFVITVLLLLFLLDNAIRTSNQLAAATGNTVIGGINLIQGGDKDLRVIWDEENPRNDYAFYRDLLRSLRFEINKSLNGSANKVLGITSLSEGEGKTFIASSLAYAFALINKKVLLIGDDYPNLTELISNKQQNGSQAFESFLVKKEIKTEDMITVLNKNPNNKSLLEINGSNNLMAAFDVLKGEFDIIIIDLNSLKNINQVKEWLLFAEKSVAIFEAGNKISAHDREFLKQVNAHEGFLGWIINKVHI
ncbi:exopolysaccharide transport family protein [Parapedobacter tibetensis]|uniref:exopolysaccharide transport family protein n=1 Tax=Parapedobacter tibetensis TaxID=2972951 RepID=UPI00214D83EC|nr:lipopolysaccharide biosynthesis protein [Parapedobacter tibetensis]